MKRIFSTVMLSLFLFSSSPSFAAEKVSCDDLTELANDLEDIAREFNKTRTFREGSEVDKSLSTLVDSLRVLAKSENEAALNNSIDWLEDAYGRMDAKLFSHRIAGVVTQLDHLHRRDCE